MDFFAFAAVLALVADCVLGVVVIKLYHSNRQSATELSQLKAAFHNNEMYQVSEQAVRFRNIIWPDFKTSKIEAEKNNYERGISQFAERSNLKLTGSLKQTTAQFVATLGIVIDRYYNPAQSAYLGGVQACDEETLEPAKFLGKWAESTHNSNPSLDEVIGNYTRQCIVDYSNARTQDQRQGF